MLYFKSKRLGVVDLMNNIIRFPTKEGGHMLDILDVARYFLSLGSMNHKKLQKLCYYAQAWYYVFCNDEKLIDTYFEAWMHGPVSPQLYREYREWGSLVIPQITYQMELNIPEEKKEFIRKIFYLYKNYSADELEALTHQEKPWREARGNIPPDEACTNKINEQTIKDYYKGVING